jgi:enoyl-CoA hydratase/carnithine racemase
MSDCVLCEQKEHIAYVTLNSPKRMNALSQDVRKGLIDAFMKVRHEPSIRVAIITGQMTRLPPLERILKNTMRSLRKSPIA